ncbi:hypothetical protein [Methylophaga sp. OBS4]|uniref:hypothetical protein n=1 Tax=Methylophaga sp. OBS4 TaxID=2991935 RepID=UPI00225B03B0|nr:hypothetical protein [Methylophaga sp. OBS4]MCX4186718.1 hypothetical protein [Methylophaga sp. OBS4]
MSSITVPALPVKYRIPLLMLGFISLIFGIAGGLLRLGWSIPFIELNVAASHGALMIGGFLGTVISLERAVAISHKWAYLAPLCAAAGGLVLITDSPVILAAVLMCGASFILCLATYLLLRRQYALYQLVLLLGGLSWLLANILWLFGGTSIQLVPWWLGFLIFTIAGERLELSRFRPQSANSKHVFIVFVLLYLIGSITATVSANGNLQLLSAALLALTFWLLKNDIARHTVKQHGLTRYMGFCLLSGYIWLLAAALIGLIYTPLVPGASYDAFMHAIVIGFVFSMIFAHAPIIFPAVAKIQLPYHPVFYLPLSILHLSLIMRVSSDMVLAINLSRLAGALNAAAIGLFILTMITAAIRGKNSARSRYVES